MTLGYLTWDFVQLNEERECIKKSYEDFNMSDWRYLVKKSLCISQLRKTCDKFAETTIEEARKLRLSRFTSEMEPILDGLVSSLA